MRRLARLYPRPWRERYGAELEALLEQTPATAGAVLDLLRGAAVARLACRRRFSPGRLVGFAVIGVLVQLDVLAPLAVGSVALGHRLSFLVTIGPFELWAVNGSTGHTLFEVEFGTAAFLLALVIGLLAAFPPVRQTGLRPR
jgi:hypothetical protein